ncbi:MAG TPA: hypothetical protein VKU01_36565 [Bryobacteraceae bacterium]|nr:hypothetical protein [Bryobacteraceae bacterium]
MKRILVLALLLAAVSFAQTKPNFTGTWKLNVSKSDFGPLPAPESRLDTIEQTDGGIKDAVVAKSAQGDQNNTISFKFDGTETANQAGGRELKMSSAWEGSALVVTTKIDFDGNAIVVKSNWTLSADGNTLTQAAHINSPMGELDQKSVFEKQAGGAAATATASTAPPSPAPAKATGAIPNLSGVWKLDTAKSDFGPLPGPESETQTVDHNEPSLKVAVASVGPQGKQNFDLNLTTDGKECVNHAGELVIKSTAGWESGNLVVNSKLNVQDQEIGLKQVYVVGPDGKVLTVNVHLTSAMGEADQKMVYQKQ